MDEDPKLRFYLQRREQIEEWALLRSHAAAALHQALELAAKEFLTDPAHAHGSIRNDWKGTHVFLPAHESSETIGLGLWWNGTALFRPTSFATWPIVAVTVIDGKTNPLKATVKAATATARQRHGMEAGADEWLWKTKLVLDPGATDLEAFATHCFDVFRSAWTDLGPLLRDTLTAASPAD